MRVVILGASGAVGSAAVDALLKMPQVKRVVALVRRPLAFVTHPKLEVQIVDVVSAKTYDRFLAGCDAAICTFGVGQPTKVSREEFKAVDFDAVLAFAKACKEQGVQHFELLGSVEADPASRSFYLKSKGTLREAIAALGFARFSCFQPSMLLTKNNRYDFLQGVMLVTWPVISHLLVGNLKKYRGIRVEALGIAMAQNLNHAGKVFEVLQWPDFQKFVSRTKAADIS
jgi:uncharacterized protein YbjT (DUF2867 family)